MSYLDDTGLAYFWGKIKAYVAALLAPKADDADVVHKTGTETVQGDKTFKPDGYLANNGSDAPVVIRNRYFDRTGDGNAADTAFWTSLTFGDKQNDVADRDEHGYFPGRLADVQHFVSSSSYGTYLRLTCYKGLYVAGEPDVNSALYVGITNSGTPYASLSQSPPANSNSTWLATTEWVRGFTGNATISDSSNTGWGVTNGTYTLRFEIGSSHVNRGIYDETNSSWMIYSNASETIVNGRCTGTASNVTGTVAIANGGTGATTRLNAIKALTNENVGTDFTHILCLKYDWSKVGYTTLAELISAANLCTTNTAQTISGNKTYTGGVDWKSTSMDRTNTSTSVDQWRTAGNFLDKNGLSLAVYSFHMAGTRNISWRLYDSSGTQHWLVSYEIAHNGTSPSVQVGGDLYTMDNGTKYLGLSSRRWKAVYAVNGTIQTSDERIKEDVADLPEAVLDAWDSVEWKQFRMKDSVAKKGSSARLHSGVIAQHVGDAFSRAGLDASAYGFFCWDRWDQTPAQLDENGNVAVPATPAGEQYSIRYDEALAIEAAYQRRENARLRARLAALEDRLAALELRLGSE